MDAEINTHTFLAMIIEESVCFMSCEPFYHFFFTIILNEVISTIIGTKQPKVNQSPQRSGEDDKHAHGFAYL
jgi:hypothetical protein